MQLSFWERESFFKDLDIVVIGSGIVGLNAALNLKLKSPKLNILVVERSPLPYGASTRNAGFACFGSISELLDDFKSAKEDQVFSLVEKRWKGLQKLISILGEKNIGLEKFGGYELFTKDDEELFEKCADIMPYLNHKLGSVIGKEVYKISDHKIQEFGFKNISNLIETPYEAQINTGKMMTSLLKKTREAGVTVLNGLEIKGFNDKNSEVEIDTAYGIIKTNKLLITTNGFAKQLLPELEVNPARAQVLITHPIPGLKIKGTFHYDKGYYYFRNVGDRVLLGGGRNLDFKTEETTEFALTDLVQNKLKQLLNEVILPGTPYSIDMQWSGIMGMGSVKAPIVKKTGNNTFCAVRMGGMGVALGSLTGEEAADLIIENF